MSPVSDATRTNERSIWLYGHPDGGWLLLEGTRDTLLKECPGRIGDLVLMGPPYDEITRAYSVVHYRRTPGAQTVLGRIVGMSQRTVSLHVGGGPFALQLTDAGWSALVRFVFATRDELDGYLRVEYEGGACRKCRSPAAGGHGMRCPRFGGALVHEPYDSVLVAGGDVVLNWCRCGGFWDSARGACPNSSETWRGPAPDGQAAP